VLLTKEVWKNLYSLHNVMPTIVTTEQG